MGSDNHLSLGEFLRQEREKRGMTIEQVASATKINVRILHSLEDDQYEELPAKPFIRGFVTSYARFVGLDPREILTQFGTFIDTRAQERPSREGGHSGYAFEKREGDQNSRTVLAAILGAMVVGGGIVLLMKPSFLKHKNRHVDKLRSAHSQPSPSSSMEPVLGAIEEMKAQSIGLAQPLPMVLPKVLTSPSMRPASSPVPSSLAWPKILPSPAPLAKPSPLASPKILPSPAPSAMPSGVPEDSLNSGIALKPSEIKYKVKFKATAPVWIRYQVDDRPMMVFVLKEGKSIVLRGQRLIKFQASDPAALTVSQNGASPQLLKDSPLMSMRQEDATVLLSPAGEASSGDLFPGEKALSSRPKLQISAPPKSP